MTTVCVARLKKELKKLKKDPNQYFETVPLTNDIRTWHFVLKGPVDSPYDKGLYHGVLKFPKDYPYKPPSIMLFTPNGRFQINTKICLSNSEFHPESWSPLWNLSNILTGFVSFMTEESKGIGSFSTSEEHRKLLAKQSLQFNCRNPQFRKLFPKYYQEHKDRIENGQKEMELLGEVPSGQDMKKNVNRREGNGDRDQIFDWMVIIIIIMCLAYGWQNFL